MIYKRVLIILMFILFIFLAMTFSDTSRASVEIKQTNFEATTNNYTVIVLAAAEFINDSGKPVEIYDINLTITDNEGNNLSSIENIGAIPSVISSGEKSYAGGLYNITSIKTPDKIGGVNFSFNTRKKPKKGENLLEVSNINPLFNNFDFLYVTGKIENTTSETVEYSNIIVPFFDEDNKLLGVLKGTIETDIEPGNNISFETDQYTGITFDVFNDAVKFEGKAEVIPYPQTF